MRPTGFIGRAAIPTALCALLGLAPTGSAPGQDLANRQEPAPAAGRPLPATDGDIKAIDDDYDRQMLGLERRRLERLSQLAARQKPADAAATYERLFRLAAAANLFGDAEAAANAVLDKGSPSPVAMGLAHTVKIIAEIDRGDYERSRESLRKAVADADGPAQAGAA
jgi:hypothetical protein